MKTLTSIVAIALLTAMPAAAQAPATAIAKCATSRGTIAVTDGDTQGWTKFGLGSPRELIGSMVRESGCFTLHDGASGRPADFLMSAIAGDKAEIDRSMEAARAVATETALRSGALYGLGRSAPLIGGALGMLGGFGGKKKTISAGLRVIAPATGQTLAVSSGESSKRVVTWGGSGVGGSGTLGSYTSSKDGQMLTSAFATAYNGIVAQAGALTPTLAAAPMASAALVTAVDTRLYTGAAKGASLRALRSGTSLTPTGKRQGLFVEVRDSAGTQGWVSVEDLR